MNRGFEIDAPIQNFDEDEDDLNLEDDFDTNVNTLRDEFDLDGNDPNPLRETGSSFISSSVEKIKKVLFGGYGKLPNTGIELHRFDESQYDLDSTYSNDDLGLMRDTKRSGLTSVIEFFKKFLSYMLILVLIVVVIVLSVLLSKKSSRAKPGMAVKHTLSNGTDLFYPTTILISLDGFHPHYISSELTPTLHSFLQKGYGPPFMIPSFPSSTFPNHWTIATGLYPESHGIVGNRFFDPISQREFVNVSPEQSLDPYFWGGEPIWSTAESQGVRSAIHMYPGSEVVFKKGNLNPSIVDKFNKTETLEVKSRRIFEWLDQDFSKRPELIIGYIPTIDTIGHKVGIKGEELEKGLKYVDSFIKNLTQGIADRNASDIINLVFVSDHGMAPTSNKRLVYLDDLIDTRKVKNTDGWPLFGLRPIANVTVEELYNDLELSYQNDSGYSIYLKEDLPKEWNFGGKTVNKYSDRIAPIWVIPDVGYSITTHDVMERKNGDYTPKGVHGYNNTEVLMRAIFLGTGPYFKSRSENDESFKVRPFKNIEVYNIICETLNLKPSTNNGTTNIFSLDNKLDADWKDSLKYPGVNFDIGGILKHDSTYDELFRIKDDKKTKTLKASEDAHGATKTKSSTNVSHEEKATTIDNGDKSTEKQKPTPKPQTETKHNDKPSHIEENKTPHKTKIHEPEASKHKGFFDNLQDDLKEIGEDLKEGIEDIAEDFEEAIDKFAGHNND